jgi:beta-N-acetylhexosaminidase
MNKAIYLLLFVLLVSSFNNKVSADSTDVIFSDSEWVDSLMRTLTPEQKIAQLFMVAAYSNKTESHQQEIIDLIEQYQIGGLMFMQGGPVRQLRLINLYQSLSQTPLMIAQDAEWGLSMRVDSMMRFPWQMTLGAIQDQELIYQMGLEIAQQCQRLGVHINFAPVVDVNSNPDNPIINNRSFGEDPQRVADMSSAYMRGLQDGGVMACAKHFPGHGDTDADSHKTLPTVAHTRERLDSIDLVPFNKLISEGIGSIMVAHLHIPQLDSTDSLASSLSKKVVAKLLKEELGFNGLVVTDALNMKGVSQFFEPGEVDLKALLAGNDVLLFAEDVPVAIQKIKEAIEQKQISQEEIDARCRKILMAKKWFGLDDFKPLKEEMVYEDLLSEKAFTLNRKLVKNSITLLQNNNQTLPLKSLDTLNIAAVCIGERTQKFEDMISNYAKVDIYHLAEEHSEEERKKMLNELLDYNLVIASIHKSNANAWKSYHIHQNTDRFLQSLGFQSKVILTIFANPYSLSDLLMTYLFDGLVLAYQNSDYAQEYAAQAIFGGIGLNATLPVSTKHFGMGEGLKTNPIRLAYTSPNDLGIPNYSLHKVDSIVNASILEEAMPGCQIIAIKEGNVFYNKSFGYHTYKKERKVLNSDLYDIASVTKIAASVPALMKLYEEDKIDLNKTLGDYVSLPDTSNKRGLSLRDILIHQAGLAAWIPFYKQTLTEDNLLRDTLYSTTYSDTFSVEVAEGIFLDKQYVDSIFVQIVNSDLRKDTAYKYSDLGYYFFKKMIEDIQKTPLDSFVSKEFYNPLGLSTLTYLPKNKFEVDRIVPTEFDYYFRSQLLEGDVHDMGAAMQGGVGGHAGLFSNANDLGILMQMYLQEGQYAGQRYFKSKTVNDFTKYQNIKKDNRRGLGFDKPILDGEGGPACDCNPSAEAFGHSGFTGTLVWADPEEDFVYVFLSNRIHPTAENKKLIENDVRTNIMQVFYDAIRMDN